MFECEPRITERGSPSLVGRGIVNSEQFSRTSQVAGQTQEQKNRRQIICYARKYSYVLDTGNASTLTTLTGPQRRHAMEALTVLSKSIGCYDRWCDIRKHYQLRWTNGNESLVAMQRFFDSNQTLDVMLERVRTMMRVLPATMAAIIRFACITGLRPVESCEAVRLLLAYKGDYSIAQYYNPDQQVLQHYRFPDIFLRQTKKAYISYLSLDNYHAIASLGSNTPTWNAIRKTCRRKNINMEMHLCRKVFASWLIQSGIDSTTVDLLQGRVPQSILVRHYQAPDATLRQRVLSATAAPEKEITI